GGGGGGWGGGGGGGRGGAAGGGGGGGGGPPPRHWQWRQAGSCAEHAARGPCAGRPWQDREWRRSRHDEPAGRWHPGYCAPRARRGPSKRREPSVGGAQASGARRR